MDHPRADATTCPASEDRPIATTSGYASIQSVHSCDRERVGARAELSDGIVLVGRDLHEGGLCLRDSRLSRVHARLTFDSRAGAYRIGDAHSRNGTFVNGRRVETALLTAGDVIRVGDSLLVYGEGDPMQRTRAQLAAAAPTPATVLLLGETGTGKELLARALHEQSGRPGPFVAINCASVPSDLISAELFGHTRHAFSGAAVPRKGVFAAAERGTLFLDEVGECAPALQAALLRALQEKAIRPVGAEREVPVDVRVVAATNVDLGSAIEAGRFRADLYARLSQIALRLPPLRERRTEIIALAEHFAAEHGRRLELSADAAEALLCWHWPLNVRELQSMIGACALRARDGALGLKQLHAVHPQVARVILERAAQGGQGMAPGPASVSARQELRALLERHAGNISAVAQILGKPRAQIYRWMRAQGLTARTYRK